VSQPKISRTRENTAPKRRPLPEHRPEPAPDQQQLQAFTSNLVQRAPQTPIQLTPTGVRVLQRAIGNHAVDRLLADQQRQPVSHAASGHATLRVGPADDKYEREADRVAAHVGRQVPDSAGTTVGVTPKQKAATEQRLAQRQVGPEGGSVAGDLARRIQDHMSGGRPVPLAVRRPVQEIMGADLSGVRYHDGPGAHAINAQLGAKASTHRNRILLGKNQSPADMRLMAHELTHVVQQGGAPMQRVQLIRYAQNDTIPFTAANPQNAAEQKQYSGFVVGVTNPEAAADDDVIYDVEAFVEGLNKSLMVQGGRVVREDVAPAVAGVDQETASIFSDHDDRLTDIVGLPVVFVTDANRDQYTRFGAVASGDILVGEGILIKKPADDDTRAYVKAVVKDLVTISKTKSGKALLLSMNAAARGNAAPNTPNILTTILRAARNEASNAGPAAQQWQGDQRGDATSATVGYLAGFAGVHTPGRWEAWDQALPLMNEQQRTENALALTDPLTEDWGRAKHKPSDVTLFHEMIHAEDVMRGRLHKETAARQGHEVEVAEMRAVGLEEYYDEDFIQGRTNRPTIYSENTYRHERQLAPRAWYREPAEGPLRPVAQIAPEPLQPVPAMAPVPARVQGASWLKHKLTPGDHKITNRKYQIAVANLYNQGVQGIVDANAVKAVANAKAPSRSGLLGNVRQTSAQANMLATAYDNPPPRVDANVVLPELPEEREVAAKSKRNRRRRKGRKEHARR
jgi:hypothetical protein